MQPVSSSDTGVPSRSIGLELSRFLRQPVKTQFSLSGELCHGIVS
jgi:hypothetical protein